MPLENEGTCRAVKQYRPSRGIRCSWKRARGYISDTSYREGELADLSHPVTSFARSREGVHIDTRFTRYRADGSVLVSYDSLYIVTKQSGRWGVLARSSFAP